MARLDYISNFRWLKSREIAFLMDKYSIDMATLALN